MPLRGKASQSPSGTGGLFDKRCYDVWLRHEDRVTSATSIPPNTPLWHETLAPGGIMLSWVTTKYQVGFVLYAGSLIVLLKNASKPRRTWGRR